MPGPYNPVTWKTPNPKQATPKKINEFQISWENLKKVFMYIHHKIFLDLNTLNAR
jgi:hypothetical protein